MSASFDVQHPAVLLGLKAAFRRMIEAIGGVDQAAALTRVGKSSIGYYGAPHCDQFAPVDVVLALEEVSPIGPAVTAYLARRAGHVLIALPEARANAGDYLRAIGRFMRGSGALSVGMVTALDDRRVDARESAALCAEIDVLLADLVGLKMALEAEHG